MEWKKNIILIAMFLILAIPYSGSVLSQTYDQNEPQNTPISESFEGTYLAYDVEITEDMIIFTDVTYSYEDEEYDVFSEMIIEGDFNMPFDSNSIFENDAFQFVRKGLHLTFNDTENGELRILQTSIDQVEVKIIIAPGIEWEAPAEDHLGLIISDEHKLTISWSDGSHIRVEKIHDIVDISFTLHTGGFVSTYMEYIPQEQEPEEHIPQISIDSQGYMSKEGADISVVKRKVVKGDVELTVSSDIPGSRIIQLNLSRAFIGSEINDLSDIKVSLDGEELEYVGANKLHSTEEQGYYVSIVNGETHVFLSIDSTQHEVRVYEVSQEVTSAAQPLSFTEMVGIFVGIVVVIGGMTALFFKKKM